MEIRVLKLPILYTFEQRYTKCYFQIFLVSVCNCMRRRLEGHTLIGFKIIITLYYIVLHCITLYCVVL